MAGKGLKIRKKGRKKGTKRGSEKRREGFYTLVPEGRRILTDGVPLATPRVKHSAALTSFVCPPEATHPLPLCRGDFPSTRITIEDKFIGGARKSMSEWAAMPSAETNLEMLATCKDDIVNDALNGLYRIQGATVTIDVSKDAVTSNQNFWPDALVEDYSFAPGLTAKIDSEVICELAGIPGQNADAELKERLEDSSLLLKRAVIYIRRSVSADKNSPDKLYVNHHVVAGAPQFMPLDRWAPTEFPCALGVVASTLAQIKPPRFGELCVEIAGKERSCTAYLMLVKGSKYDQVTENRMDSFYIKNRQVARQPPPSKYCHQCSRGRISPLFRRLIQAAMKH